MKKIKVYIITYKRNKALNELLENIFSSNISGCDLEVNIINNHSEFLIKDKFKRQGQTQVRVHHNECRVDWSNGNLAADYNFALIDGFRDLENPDCDYVITLQNDAVLNKNWCECMLNQFKKYDFIVGYLGDNIVGYTPEIVKSVGLWDENFGGVANKCADYYFRGLLYHDKEKIQINDILHRRLVNYDHELELDVINDRGFIINEQNTSRLPDDEEHKKIREEENPYRAQQTHYFLWKWQGTRPDIERKGNWNEHGYLLNWPQDIKENNPTAPKQIQFVKYPYFEKGVTDIQNKGYITDGKLVSKHNTEYTIKEIKGIK